MPSDIDLLPHGRPPTAVLAALLDAKHPSAEEAAGLYRQLAKCRSEVEIYGSELEAFYRRLAADFTTAGGPDAALRLKEAAERLELLAGELLATEQAETATLRPIVDEFRRELADSRTSDEQRRLYLDGIAVAEDWLALHRDFQEKALHLIAERRSATGDILRARPVEGEIDHAALSREFMARFPKIRAALAE